MKLIYNVEDKPKFGQLVVFALQQLLAIMAATLVVPVIVNGSIDGCRLNSAAALFGAGVGTIVYILFTKKQSPVFLGSSFAFIGSMCAAMGGAASMAAGYIGLIIGAGFAGLFAVLACILTGAGQLVVIVGKALFGLVFVGFGFAGHIVHDGFAFADDFADGANQKEVQHVQCNEEVHQLENQGDIKVQHYRILPLDGVMFKAFIKYPQQGVMSKGIGDKIRKVFASAQTIL